MIQAHRLASFLFSTDACWKDLSSRSVCSSRRDRRDETSDSDRFPPCDGLSPWRDEHLKQSVDVNPRGLTAVQHVLFTHHRLPTEA